MILATVAMCMCGSVVFAGPVAVHSNLPPDTEFETNIVAEAWSEFDRVLGVRIALPAIKKFDVAVLAVLLAVCTVVAQKGTNDPPRGASAPYSGDAPDNGGDASATSSRGSSSRGGIGSAVTTEDVARMFSVMSVGTNEVFDFTMPADATRVQKWWLRGGSNDRAFVPGGVVKIGGELLDSLRNPTNRFYPLKATSLLVAQESEFWHLGTASNSTVYTWKDAYLWRNLSLPFSMQAEIFDDGDFEYRYDLSRISDMDVLTNVVIGAKFGTNELGDVSWLLDGTNNVTSIKFHRLSEFDWDGDGLANEIDPDPYTKNGDCHGQGEGWVLASFTNSAEIVAAGGYTNWVASVVENDTDGWWYSFTITVDAFDATGHAVVRIDDKAVVLERENDSATFLLMRGRAYPFSVDPFGATFSSASYDGVQPQVEFNLGTGLVSIMAGVEILPHGATLHPIPGYSTAYFEARKWNLNPALDGITSWNSEHGRLQITPAGDGVFVFWIGSANELYDTLYCDTDFDGYTNRQSVVVRFDPDPEPLPHVALSSPNTIFVNDDDDNHNGTNDYLDLSCSFSTPDDDIVPVVVEFKSLAYVTNGTLRLSAQGLRIWEDQSHIGTPVQSLTMTNCATPFERTLYVERDSLSYSQIDECRLALEWLENAGSELGIATNMLTACEPVAEPICNKMFSHEGTNYVINPCCIVRGGRDAWFEVDVSPADYPDSKIVWECSEPKVQFIGGNTGRRVRLRAMPDCPLGMTVALTIRFGDCPSDQPMFYAQTTGLVGIRLYHQPLIGTKNVFNTYNDSELQRLDDIYSQVGIRFSHIFLPPKAVGKDAEILYSGPNKNREAPASHVAYYDGITVFYVQSINDSVRGYAINSVPNYVVLSPGRAKSLLGHEIGHMLGLFDIYRDKSERAKIPCIGTGIVPLCFDTTCASQIDWNNGTGSRFYAAHILSKDIIPRLLMFGCEEETKIDIPLSTIWGLTYTSSAMNALTLSFSPIGWQNCVLRLDEYGTE